MTDRLIQVPTVTSSVALFAVRMIVACCKRMQPRLQKRSILTAGSSAVDSTFVWKVLNGSPSSSEVGSPHPRSRGLDMLVRECRFNQCSLGNPEHFQLLECVGKYHCWKRICNDHAVQ